eukprot:TRINITY_DN2201_c3_g1_i1.p1 TRINITY_DN2201_c3_g1~~TRINITY_DN2201_c3_g1_i1.p1  ORF type:complete len:460 (+),score=176.64 TRINITY_DN2201_c3_g1_i1:79-1380(+)
MPVDPKDLPEGWGTGLPAGGVQLMKDACESPRHADRVRSAREWRSAKAQHAAAHGGKPVKPRLEWAQPEAIPVLPGEDPALLEREDEHKNWKCFITLDRNRNNMIELHEFKQVMQEHGIALPEGELEELYSDAKYGRCEELGVTRGEWRAFAARHPLLRDVLFIRSGEREIAMQTLRAAQARAVELRDERLMAEAELLSAQEQLRRESAEREAEGAGRFVPAEHPDFARRVEAWEAHNSEVQRRLAAASEAEQRLERELADARRAREALEAQLGELAAARPVSAAAAAAELSAAAGGGGKWHANQGMWSPDPRTIEPATCGGAETGRATAEQRVREAELAVERACRLEEDNARRRNEAAAYAETATQWDDREALVAIREEVALRKLRDGGGADEARLREREVQLARQRERICPSPHRLRSTDGSPPSWGSTTA